MLRIVHGCALVRTVESAGAHRRRLSVCMVAREFATDHQSCGFGGGDGEGVVAEAGDEVETSAECFDVTGDRVDGGKLAALDLGYPASRNPHRLSELSLGQAVALALFGQPVRDGKFEFVVTKVSHAKSVGDTQFGLGETAQGRFTIITL